MPVGWLLSCTRYLALHYTGYGYTGHIILTKYQVCRPGAGASAQLHVVGCHTALVSRLEVTTVPSILPLTSASKSSIRRFVITEKAPTRAFSWFKAATTAFTFKTLC